MIIGVVAGIVGAAAAASGVILSDSGGSNSTKALSSMGAAVNGNGNSVNACSGTAHCQINNAPQPTAATTPTIPLPPPINLTTSCPTPNVSVPPPPPVYMCVVYWCHAPVYTTDGQEVATEYQIKLRVIITNTSNQPVDVTVNKPSTVRLLVQGEGIPQYWQPRPGTLAYGDAPFEVTYEGQTFWAIAPNRPGTEVAVPSIGQYTGFATTWDYPPVLQPRQVDGVTTPTHDLEDLVFNVPVLSEQSQSAVFGLALLSYSGGTPHVIATAETNAWEHQEDAAYF